VGGQGEARVCERLVSVRREKAFQFVSLSKNTTLVVFKKPMLT